MILLSTAYLGNIQYYSKLLKGSDVIIEQHENYQKQSYRNRCDIMSANGVISLGIPVIKKSGDKTPIIDTRIDYSKAWQHQHWHAIVSGYRNSPYFEYFEQEFAPLYQKKQSFLWDFNAEIQSVILNIFAIKPKYRYSSEYIVAAPDDLDFRSSISPKPRLQVKDTEFYSTPYYQVFSEKFEFAPNLSIIDVLFCEGKESLNLGII